MYSNKNNNNNNSNSSSGSSNNDNSQGNNWQEDEDLPLEEVDLMSKHFMTHSSQEDSELSVDHEELVEIYRRAVARKQADESIDKDAITGLEGMDLESVEADSLTSSSMNLPPVELYSTDPYRKVNFDISNGTYSSNELDYTNQSPNTSFLPTPTDKMNYSSNKILSRKHAQPLPAGTIHFMNLPLLRRFVTDNGSIKSRVHTGLNGKDQRKVARAIKRARAVGIIPFVGGWDVMVGGGSAASAAMPN